MKEGWKLSTQQIINTLKSLVEAQKSLLALSEQKTVQVTDGQIDKLQATLVKEQKALQLVEKVETKRVQEVNRWCQDHSLSGDQATMTGMLEHLPNDEVKHELEVVATELTETIVKLKQQEELNQILLQQSMQFVQLSLELLNPSIGNMNYSGKDKTNQMGRSVFDSKA